MTIEWLDENALRAYPLKEGVNRVANTGYRLLDSVILDALMVHSTSTAAVELQSIEVTSDDVIFTVTGHTFTIPKSGDFPRYHRLTNGSLLVVSDKILGIPTGTHTFTNVKFESSVCIEFGAEWLGVQSIQFGTSTAKTGDINCIEGIQFNIDIDGQVFSLGVGRAYGTPAGCNSLGNGVDDCGDIISFINGVGPDEKHILTIDNGSGIILLEDPTNHRIFLGLVNTENVDCDPIPTNPEL